MPPFLISIALYDPNLNAYVANCQEMPVRESVKTTEKSVVGLL